MNVGQRLCGTTIVEKKNQNNLEERMHVNPNICFMYIIIGCC
jgi:hypothetical protein